MIRIHMDPHWFSSLYPNTYLQWEKSWIQIRIEKPTRIHHTGKNTLTG